MASKIIARPNQSMQDLVLMACGTLDGTVDFCLTNGVRVSDVPVVGTVYTVPDGIATNKDVLRQLQRTGTVIGTLNRPPSVLVPVTGRRTILDPRLDPHAFSSGPGSFFFTLDDASSMFTNYYALQPAFDAPANAVLFQGKTDYELSAMPVVVNASPNTPPFKLLRWVCPTAMGGGVYLYWSDLDAGVVTSTWKDVNGNTAIYAPLILAKATLEIHALIPWIDVIVEGMSDYEILFRITWVHPPVPGYASGFHINSFEWLGAAVGGIPVTGVPNCINISLPVGVYTLGAVTHYVNDDASVQWPDSYKTLVIEVY